MPNPFLLTLSCAAAALSAAAACAFLLSRLQSAGPDSPVDQRRLIWSLAAGVVAGSVVQELVPSIPPATALDRWLLIALPLLLAADVIACGLRSRRHGRLLRMAATAALAPLLLFGSVHLQSPPPQLLWPGLTAGGLLTVGTCSLIPALLADVMEHPRGIQPWWRAATGGCVLQSAGLAVMLGGWIRGGAAMLPLTGSFTGVLITGALLHRPAAAQVILRWSFWSLCGVLLLGHFFGRLSGLQVTALLLAWTWPVLLPVSLLPASGRLRTVLWMGLTLLLLTCMLGQALADCLLRLGPLMACWNSPRIPDIATTVG